MPLYWLLMIAVFLVMPTLIGGFVSYVQCARQPVANVFTIALLFAICALAETNRMVIWLCPIRSAILCCRCSLWRVITKKSLNRKIKAAYSFFLWLPPLIGKKFTLYSPLAFSALHSATSHYDYCGCPC